MTALENLVRAGPAFGHSAGVDLLASWATREVRECACDPARRAAFEAWLRRTGAWA